MRTELQNLLAYIMDAGSRGGEGKKREKIKKNIYRNRKIGEKSRIRRDQLRGCICYMYGIHVQIVAAVSSTGHIGFYPVDRTANISARVCSINS